MGDGLALVAFPLLATRLTHDARLIAGVALATRLPWLLVSLPAGAIADRVDRRRLLAAVELLRMAVLIALAVSIASHRVDLAQIYAAAFVLGSCETAFIAATQAVVPQLVPTDQLARANGRLVVSESSGEQFVGPAIGGLAFAAAASLPFVADGVSFAASAVLLTRALPRRDRAVEPSPGPAPPRRPIRRDVAEGLRWLAGDRVLRATVALIASFAFCQALGMAILVVYGLVVLHLSGAGYGFFVAASALGNLLGAAVARRALARRGTAAVLVAAGILAAAGFAVVGLTSDVVVAAAALAAEAVAVGIGNVATLSLRQARIPDHLAGRVNAASRMCTLGSASVAALLGGALVTFAGPHAPFLIGAGIQLVAAVALGAVLGRHLGWTASDATVSPVGAVAGAIGGSSVDVRAGAAATTAAATTAAVATAAVAGAAVTTAAVATAAVATAAVATAAVAATQATNVATTQPAGMANTRPDGAWGTAPVVS